jgi:hypothetical protein
MRIICFIEDHKVIDRIIAHLKLTFHAERPLSPQSIQQELLTTAEERAESITEWLVESILLIRSQTLPLFEKREITPIFGPK